MQFQSSSTKFQRIIDDLVDQYEFADKSDRSWIIGFSGGKDSTVLLMLVWEALQKLKDTIPNYHFRRMVYVVCNDTLVENPIIEEYVHEVLTHIQRAAVEQGMPITVKKTSPKLEESFWINVIGRGYPVPNNTFRWCTDRLKIRPTSSFLHEQINEKGEAIVLLGTRYSESSNREKSIKKHEVKGSRLSPHTANANTMTYAPIKELELEEVWYLINTKKAQWGFDNKILFNIYADASSDDYECPTVVTTKEHKSCGQSRFGCWTCTVVKRDKSMSSLIENGQEWMAPLLELRDQMQLERNINENRDSTRRNGQLAISEDGINQGNYTIKYRADLLRRILHAQKEIQKVKPHLNLISNQELIAIQVLWNRDLEFNFSVSELYKEFYEKDLDKDTFRSINPTERRIISEECKDDPEILDLIENLISIQETKSLLVTNYGMTNDFEKLVEQKATKS